MHSYFKFSLYAILLVAATAFIACQNEEPFEEDIDPERTLTAGSTVIEMMKRTTSNDGSYDNIVDGASCLGIQFPYMVTVNGSELTIASMEDLQKIENLFDAVDEGEHSMEIAFPVTITMADYTEATVNSEEELHDYVEQCVEGGDDNDIECADVVYPVSLFTYNPNLQQTGSVVVNQDKELRRFLAGLADTDLISIEFPLTFDVFDGTEVTVSNNTELAAAMERAIEICDEDDDDDHNDDDFTEKSLDSLLVTCPWSVKELAAMDLDNSERYQDYLLTFNEDGKVVSDNGFGSIAQGEWSVSVSDFKVFLTMEFKDAQEFNGTRYTYEIGEGEIKGEAGENNTIILEQACGFENQSCDQNFIEETLSTECRWGISNEQGEFSENIDIDFSNKNIYVYDSDNTVVDEGNWSISGTTISFDELSMSLAIYVGDWEVITCSEERFRLQRGDEVIVLVKQCNYEQSKRF